MRGGPIYHYHKARKGKAYCQRLDLGYTWKEWVERLLCLKRESEKEKRKGGIAESGELS